ncbi:MAG: hypothetical protein EA349_15010 [Halomonadaceae bacterium]|nr:MAG: hypothetical protein EA349_15010 [Halomonadaceae bacterium]
MGSLLYLLSVCLVAASLWAVPSGRLFFGGRMVDRDSEGHYFYLGMAGYLVLAVFAVLFARAI